ncbi:Xaa-Pro aminopeptidase [Rubricella aquisinus]|uniref:Xaa-Pro aminopeptidase n=1 Tax=Rubricella aquisinus TaxID=2028108 RepID=A0A840X2K4_9RHOB|nr:aminopeptidase P family protein [Rubricella aquisinus]MBB5516076.1 Xaa-Pro aminopeptidase [Rubricella aquisinus]
MFQTFDIQTSPDTAAPRIAALRAEMARAGVDAFLVPRADAHQGETVAPRDERLKWLTGFTGSAGLAIAGRESAAVFVDGRYTLQVRTQCDAGVFEFGTFPGEAPARWLRALLPEGGIVAYDPWLHGVAEIDALSDALRPAGITLQTTPNLIDAAWPDQPAPPQGEMTIQPHALAGATHEQKRLEIAEGLSARGAQAALLTLPDAIAWLLNIRGSDIARMPVAQGFAILHADGQVDLYGMEQKLTPEVRSHLGNSIRSHDAARFLPDVEELGGTLSADRASTPVAVIEAALAGGATLDWHDPIALPKARKSEAEIAGAHAAHLRDGAAFAEFLCWLDHTAPGDLTEIAVCEKLEAFRQQTGALKDISFETICGAGPNGAIVHYRVNTDTNRALKSGELLLVDSGGQYQDGTTDITRTIAIGPAGEEERRAFTLVLKGMIAISRLRFPAGIAGRDIDALARAALWQAGYDYAHGTGHGVGSYLGVHEGPQRIARTSHIPLEPGMILSNEPGYYREGAFGIRIENLIVVRPTAPVEGGDINMHQFDTLTLAPIDRRLINPMLLTNDERDWLDAYHAHVLTALTPVVSPDTASWLAQACAPL